MLQNLIWLLSLSSSYSGIKALALLWCFFGELCLLIVKESSDNLQCHYSFLYLISMCFKGGENSLL